MITFSDIEDAFMFVSSDQPFMNTAIINKITGETYYHSELSDEDNFPVDIEDDKYIEIPHKNDLDLGQNLVFEFASKYIPDRIEEVYSYFSRKGAYSKYKYLLERLNLLEKWYEFEDERTKIALHEWCHDNDIEFE